MQPVQQASAGLQALEDQIIHVRIMPAVSRNEGTARPASAFKVDERCVILIPELQPSTSDRRAFLQLGQQEGGIQIAGRVRRPDIDPGILILLPSKELAAVGDLLPDDFRLVPTSL